MRALDDLEAFDIVFMKDVIEHIEDDRGFLSVVTKHLKPNGYMVVTTPNSFSLGHCLDVLYHRWYLGNKAYVGGADPTHVRLYSTFRLRRLMAECGLRRRKLHAVGIFPANVISYVTRSKYKGSYYGFIDRIIGGLFPFSVIGTGQLNLYQKMR
jgi:2-polyprenyl-3-methyl-5-hydroxy-6-metoxy-1,4-benzoquinol methylase